MAREYKDSGIEWIGQIPKEWEVIKLKHESQFINGYAFDSNDFKLEGDVRVVRIGDIGFSIDWNNCIYVNNSAILLDAYKICNGDILIAMSGATTGKCCLATNIKEAYINQRVGIIRSEKRKLVFFSLLAPYFKEYVNLNNAGSAQPNISSKAIGEFPLVMPKSLSEQQKIVDYLDKVCGEVDEMATLQETMIEELKAYKQSVITEAVTKGLNPNVSMRDSGIDWIGEIPEHWDNCAPLKWFVNIILGKMLQSDAKSSDDSLEDYICAKDVHFGGIEYSDLKKMYFSQEEKKQYKIQKGDMLVVEGGAGAAGASIVQTDIDNIYIQNSIMIARPARCVDISYVCYSLFSLVSRGYVDYVCNKATIPHFTKEKLSKTVIALPPMDEQRIIASFLDTKCSEIDSLIALKQAKIEELKEYKKSVIYEYVTGKKEVI